MLFLDNCNGLGDVVSILKSVYNILKFAIPFVLLLFGAIDLGKAVIASKEDEMKKAQGTFIKRIVYAVIIFLLFSIVNFVISILPEAQDDNLTNTDWVTCWNNPLGTQ